MIKLGFDLLMVLNVVIEILVVIMMCLKIYLLGHLPNLVHLERLRHPM